MRTIAVEDLRTELGRMADRIENAGLADVLRDCAEPLRRGFGENFEAAEDQGGASWPPRKLDPLHPGSQERGSNPLAPPRTHPLLRETGALWAAATGHGAGAVERAEDRVLEVGIDKSVQLGGIPGAAVHNFGYAPFQIPAREYLYASDDTLDECQEIVADGAYTVFFVF